MAHEIAGVAGLIHMDPIGTEKAVRDAGLNPRQVGSCSEPEAKKNVGCFAWENCPFRFKGKGPKNIATRRVAPNGKLKELEMPCFRYMREHHPAVEAGVKVMEVYGDEDTGAVILVSGTEKVDPLDKKDMRRKAFAKEVPISKFPAVEEQFPEASASAKILARMAKERNTNKVAKVLFKEKGHIDYAKPDEESAEN